MPFIKNWKLTALGVVFICFFCSLGAWQLQRAKQKEVLLSKYKERIAHTPFHAKDIAQPNDWRFYRAELQGQFDNEHTFLLDNTIQHGIVGYEVYTPFRINGLDQAILVDRGFVPLPGTRDIFPTIRAISGQVAIFGLLNLPPHYVTRGNLFNTQQWPLRIEYILLPELAKKLGYSLFPYVLNLNPKDPAAYAIEWQIVIVGPERHRGYALQWFAIALTLLVLLVALNRAK